MKISLRQLAVFDAVASLGSVSRAADQLALTQSAASMSLAELEKHLSAPLFHRHNRRLILTDYGRWLQPRVHRLLAEARDIETSGGSQQLRGVLKLAASSTIGNYLLPGLLARFRQQHPEVQVELSVGNTEAVASSTRDLRADLGLIEGFSHDPHLVSQVWKNDELQVFCAPEHPLAAYKTLTDDQLREAEWVLREPGSGTREIFTLAVAACIPRLRLGIELGNSEAVKRAVRHGAGLGCLSRHVIAEDAQRGELHILHCPQLQLQRSLYLLTRDDVILTPLTKGFLHFLHRKN